MSNASNWSSGNPDPETARLLRTKAGRLCRLGGFSQADREDIEQELSLHLWRNAALFDPAVTTWLKFASFILDKRGVSLLRERTAAKRNRRREDCSLDDQVLDDDGRVVPRHETTPEAASDPTRLRDLERDMAQVLAGLSDDLRAAALALAFGTQNSVGPELGISRRAMAKAVDQLREIFRDAGLDQYL